MARESKAVAVAQHHANVDRTKVLRKLARLGFSDMRRFVESGPQGVVLKASTALTDDEAAAVLEVSETMKPGGMQTLKIKLHDKKSALHMLGTHLSLFRTSAEGDGLSVQTDVLLAIFVEVMRAHVPAEQREGAIQMLGKLADGAFGVAEV